MVPRAIMNDFRDNFGNFSACFAVETNQEQPSNSAGAVDRFGNSLEEIKEEVDNWGGNI